jgi:hypothetical protein
MNMKKLQILATSLFIFFAINVNAETPVEVKLIAPIEEDRGWCLDLRGGQNNGKTIGGLHGHTCYTYNGNGPTPDQAFVMENVQEQNEFRMVAFNEKCMTLYEPKAGSFISMETCDDRKTQDFTMNEAGQIIPKMMPELCLTLHSAVVPGGGGNPVHIMRDVAFDACDSNINERQLWELRAEWTGPEETTAERPYAVNPRAAPPGMGPGMGAGMGMGGAGN